MPEPIRIEKLGDVGYIADPRPFEIPPNALSDALNVRCTDGSIETAQGWDHFRTLIDPCYFVTWHQSRTGEKRWFLANLTNAYAYDEGDIHQIGSGLSGANEMAWSSCSINGQLILSNGVDPLFYWDGEDITGTGLTALPNWDGSLSAGTVVSYKNFVIAGNLQGTITDPFAIIWSHPADPTASPPVPPSWDYTDPTLDAGLAYLPPEGGGIQLMLRLRDSVAVYRERATHFLDYTGGTFILRIRDFLQTTGCLGPHSACEIQGQRHLVVTRDDVVVHDGQNLRSIATHRVRKQLFSAIDTEHIERVYCVADHDAHEVWICYPGASNEWPVRALVWSWDDDTWTPRELSGTTFLAYGEFIEETGDPVPVYWDDVPDDVVWNDMDGTWDLQRFTAAKGALMSLGGAGLNMEWLNTYDPEVPVGGFTQRAERLGLNLTGDETVAMITAVYPRIRITRAPPGAAVNFWIGSQEGPMDQTVTWRGPFPLYDEDQYASDTGKPYRLTMRVSGRRHAWRIESVNADWRLEALDFDVRKVGGR